MKPSCGPLDWGARRSLARRRTRLPGLDLGLTSRVQADRGGRPMLTIGKLAHSAGVSSDTLRYYEQEGLIEPAGKSPAGYRIPPAACASSNRPSSAASPSQRSASSSSCAAATPPAAGMSANARSRRSGSSKQDPLDARDVQGA